MPQLFAAMSTKGKLTLAAVAAGFLIVVFVLFRMASAPAYTEVLSGADPQKTGKVTAALDAAGVAYEVRAAGTAVAVDKAMLSQARIALASSGLGAGASEQPGFELLDKQKLGASSFQQQVAYQRALEGEIASTVDQVEGVDGASVALTLPKDQLFADESEGATAAVLLGGGATQLDGGQVRGIANLVASSVQGLKPAGVTITDGTGVMLWPAEGAAGAGGMGKPAAQARYDQKLTSQLNAMLATTLGAGRATVSVASDLNVDEATKEQLTYAKTGTPLEVKKEVETLRGRGGAAGGAAAGTGTNLPAYAQTTGGGVGSSSNYRKSSETSKIGVDKVVTRTKVAAGTVNKLNVAVMVDQAAKADIPAIRTAISSAAGIDLARGDKLAVEEVAFAKVEEPVAPPAGLPVPAALMGYAKVAGLGLLAVIFLFFVTRHLRRREDEVFAQEPSWLKQLDAPRALGTSSGMSPEDEERMRIETFDAQAAARKVFENDPRALALEDLVVREPEKVAHQLRTWITEDGA